jgi:hypothetical protein
MVLIALFLACAGPKTPHTPVPEVSVHTALMAHAPADTTAIQQHVIQALTDENLKVLPVSVDSDWERLGTSGHRTAWLLERSEGALSLLVEAEARRRATLVGRYQWEVTATIAVAESTLPTLEQTKVMRVTLPHSHQDENDALTSAAPRIGHYAASLVRQFHGRSE